MPTIPKHCISVFFSSLLFLVSQLAVPVALPEEITIPVPDPQHGISAKNDKTIVDFRSYMKQLQDSIKKSWTPPESDVPKQTIVDFAILRGDKVSNLNIFKSSDDSVFDALAVRAVATATLPSLPEDAPLPVSIRFSFDYKCTEMQSKSRPAHKTVVTRLLSHTNLAWKTFSIRRHVIGKALYTLMAKYPQFRSSRPSIYRLNKQIYRFVMDTHKRDCEFMRNVHPDSVTEGLNIDYAVKLATTNLVSIWFRDYQNTGGVHGMTTNMTFNSDVDKGTLIKLADIFETGTDYLKCLSDACYPIVLKQLEGSQEECLDAGLTAQEESFKNFVFTKTGIRFLFEEYQLANFAESPPEAELSYQKLAPILKPGSIITRLLFKLPEQREDLDTFQKKISGDKAIALISFYSKKIGEDPKNAGYYFDRGRAYDDFERYEPTIMDYTKSLEIEPNQGVAYYNRGIAYDGLRNWEKAVADYSTALKMDPTLTASYRERGADYLRLKEYEKAIDDLSRAIVIDKNDHCLFCRRGLAYLMDGSYKKAVADFTSALNLETDDSHCYYHRAEALLSLGKPKEALSDVNKAIELCPQIGAFYATRASICERLGKSKEAEQDRTICDGLNSPQDTRSDCL